jgi:hypothetical protein
MGFVVICSNLLLASAHAYSDSVSTSKPFPFGITTMCVRVFAAFKTF